MTRRFWSTATAGRSYGKGIIARCLLFIFWLFAILTVAWAVGNQTVIQ